MNAQSGLTIIAIAIAHLDVRAILQQDRDKCRTIIRTRDMQRCETFIPRLRIHLTARKQLLTR